MIRNQEMYEVCGIVFPDTPLDAATEAYLIDDTPVAFTEAGVHMYNSRCGDVLRKAILLGINAAQGYAPGTTPLYESLSYAQGKSVVVASHIDIAHQPEQDPHRALAYIIGVEAVMLYEAADNYPEAEGVDLLTYQQLESNNTYTHSRFKQAHN